MRAFFSATSILALLAVSAGCKTVCNEVNRAQADLTDLNSKLAKSASNDAYSTQMCKTSDADTRFLFVDSQKAEKGARRHLSHTETVCTKSHYVRVCDTDVGPYDPYVYGGHPLRVCSMQQVCDQATQVFHKKDGYDEAMNLAANLREVRVRVLEGCYAYNKGFTDEGAKKLADARDLLDQARATDDLAKVREVAGCNK